ncbi:MAG: TRAP transporter small permease [Campylobacterales bacterium]|nr:TRAP transporter small permease [Campylobacterales bacterium]
MFRLLDNLIGFINKSIAAIGISAGVALAFSNVIARYVFDNSLTWAAELTIYLFLWSTFFGSAYCFKKDAHISIDILLEKLSPKLAKSLMILSHTITFIFLCAVAYYGLKYVLFVYELEEVSVDLELPMWIIYIVIPISFSFGAFRVAEKIYEMLTTPANEVLKKSEAEMIVAQMGKGEDEKLLKEVERRTGGML